VSGLLFRGGPPSRILDAVAGGQLTLVLPDPVVEETARVATVKLGTPLERWRSHHATLVELAAERPPHPSDPVPAVSGDRADDVILARAVRAEVDVIITGDRRHMLPLGNHEGIPLMTPQALLAQLRRG